MFRRFYCLALLLLPNICTILKADVIRFVKQPDKPKIGQGAAPGVNKGTQPAAVNEVPAKPSDQPSTPPIANGVLADPVTDDTAWTYVVFNQCLNLVNAEKVWKETVQKPYENNKCVYRMDSNPGNSAPYIILQLVNSSKTNDTIQLDRTTKSLENKLNSNVARLDLADGDNSHQYITYRRIIHVLNDLRTKYPPWAIVVIANSNVAQQAMSVYTCLPERMACLVCIASETEPRPFTMSSELTWLIQRPRPEQLSIFFIKHQDTANPKMSVLNQLTAWNLKYIEDKCKIGCTDVKGDNTIELLEWLSIPNGKQPPGKKPPFNLAKNDKMPIDALIKNNYRKILEDTTAPNANRYRGIKVYHSQTGKLASEATIMKETLEEIRQVLDDTEVRDKHPAYVLIYLSLNRWRDWAQDANAKPVYQELQKMGAKYHEQIAKACSDLQQWLEQKKPANEQSLPPLKTGAGQ